MSLDQATRKSPIRRTLARRGRAGKAVTGVKAGKGKAGDASVVVVAVDAAIVVVASANASPRFREALVLRLSRRARLNKSITIRTMTSRTTTRITVRNPLRPVRRARPSNLSRRNRIPSQ
jgi:hypothetical protein